MIDQLTALDPTASTFRSDIDATFNGKLNTMITQTNATTAAIITAAMGGGIAYAFDTSVTVGDPTAGKLRLNNATENLATKIIISTTDAAAKDRTALIDTWDDPVGSIVCDVHLQSADGTKWIDFQVNSITTGASYRTLNGTVINSSVASPFIAADGVALIARPRGSQGAGATLIAPTKTIGATGILQVGDAGASVEVTTTSAITLDTSALLGNGCSFYFPRTGFAITLTTTTGTITANDGAAAAASKTIAIEGSAVLKCDGTNFLLTHLLPGDHEVTVNTGNGEGSTNTMVRRFTTTQRSAGTAITYADSPTNGGTFTINEAAMYAIAYSDKNGSSRTFGVSVNSAQLTTAIDTITAANRLLITTAPAGPGLAGGVFRLAVGDVVRAHMGFAGTYTDADAQVKFSIRKVGL